jgi:hypothetical protein
MNDLEPCICRVWKNPEALSRTWTRLIEISQQSIEYLSANVEEELSTVKTQGSGFSNPFGVAVDGNGRHPRRLHGHTSIDILIAN